MLNTFFTAFKRPPRKISPLGSSSKTTYQLEIDPDGRRILVETGVKDTYAITQSHKTACLIENIVKRAEAGDTSVLAKTQGVYCDTTLLPTDLIGAHEAVLQAQAIYRQLPVELRDKYGSFKEFIGSFGTLDGVKDFYTNLTTKVNAAASSDTAQSTNGGEE